MTNKAILKDINGQDIFEIRCFKQENTPYPEVCLLNMESDYFTGDVLVKTINYQQAATSIYDNLMYERGIMLQRSNDYCFLHTFLEFTKTLGDYLEQESEINGDAIFLSEYHEVSLINYIELVRNSNETFNVRISITGRDLYSERLLELFIKNFPHLSEDASFEFETVVKRDALENFVDGLNSLIGKAMLRSYK